MLPNSAHTFSHVGACSELLRYARRGCGYILPSRRSRPWVCDQWSRWWWCSLAFGTTTLHLCGPPTSVDTEKRETTIHVFIPFNQEIKIAKKHCWRKERRKKGQIIPLWGFHCGMTSCCLQAQKKKGKVKWSDLFLNGKAQACCESTAAKYLSEPATRFYNCFYLSVGKRPFPSFFLQKELMTVLNILRPFILISGGRLTIDSRRLWKSFWSIELVCPQFVPLVTRFNYAQCIKLKFSGGGGE